MRPPKLSRDELLHLCANTFKRLGYHGTTMDALAAACGLTKASFYHHYPNKETLLRDVLLWTHTGLQQTLFAQAFDSTLPPAERLTRMGKKAKKLFQDDSIGCLMGVVSGDAAYGIPDLLEPIRAFLDDWISAFAQLYRDSQEPEQAQALARQLVADFEGAILLARIYNDASYIDAVTARGVQQLQALARATEQASPAA